METGTKNLCHTFNRVPYVIMPKVEIKNYQSTTPYSKLHVILRSRTSRYEETFKKHAVLSGILYCTDL